MTADALLHVDGVVALACTPDGQKLRGEDETTDLIGSALHTGAEVVMVPVERLPDEFFDPGTGLVGQIAQKFVNYRLRLAIVGDISRRLTASSALREFLYETNRDSQLWFVATMAELRERLKNTRRS